MMDLGPVAHDAPRRIMVIIMHEIIEIPPDGSQSRGHMMPRDVLYYYYHLCVCRDTTRLGLGPVGT
jgi:hypothetical protein